MALAALALALDACAGQQCDFHSQCGEQFYCQRGLCRQDCQRDVDCGSAQRCNEIGQCVAVGPPGTDAGPPAGTDGGPGFDAGPPIPGVDAGPGTDAGPPIPGVDAGPGPDAGPPGGTGQYLDRCAVGGDCASGQCVDDVGGTRMCTMACSAHRDCASEHVCGDDGLCHPDDTGVVCSLSAAGSCELGLCIGNTVAGTGHCTRPCANAGECPAGYACMAAGSGRVCVDIEHGCGDGDDCESGLCLSAQGCTAECRTAADCPARLPGLPPYTCEIAFGSRAPICVPPSDVLGADPIGATCSAVGTVTCRSGACDTAAPLGPMCTQLCSQEGGCGPGLGCFPQVDGGSITQVCSRAGSRAISSSCGTGRECDSGLCDTAGYCTRLCTDDGLCPSDMRCTPVPGFSVSLCRR